MLNSCNEEYLTEAQIDLFVEKLSAKIELLLDKGRGFRLSVDYYPEEPLNQIIKEVDPNGIVGGVFPAKSSVWFDSEKNEISFDAYFQGRSF